MRLRKRVTERLVGKYKEYLALERRATVLRYKHNALLNTRDGAVSSVAVTFLEQCLKSQLENAGARSHAETTWQILKKEAQRSIRRFLISGAFIVSAMDKALSEDPDARFRGDGPIYVGNEHLDHSYWLLRDLQLLVLYEDCYVEEKFFLNQ